MISASRLACRAQKSDRTLTQQLSSSVSAQIAAGEGGSVEVPDQVQTNVWGIRRVSSCEMGLRGP